MIKLILIVWVRMSVYIVIQAIKGLARSCLNLRKKHTMSWEISIQYGVLAMVSNCWLTSQTTSTRF